MNKHNSISIPGLNDIDDIEGLFRLSDGWCGGLDAASTVCSSHTTTCNAITKTYCRATTSGGKATAGDVICVQLHRNSVAESFLLSNASIKAAYGTDASKSETWQYRHKIKHMGTTGSETPSSMIPVDAIRAVNGTMEGGSNYDPPTYADNIRKSGTMTHEVGKHTQVKIKNDGVKAMRSIAVIDLNVIYQNSNSPQKVAITFWSSDSMNYEQDDWGGSEGLHTIWSASSSNISFVKGNLGYGENSNPHDESSNQSTYYIGDENAADYYRDPEGDHYRYKSYVFDISNLTENELKTGWIQVSQQSLIHSTSGDEYGGVGPFMIATVWDKIDNCDIYGHDYQVKNQSDQVWASDYSKLTLTYTCNNNIKHEKSTYTATPTKTISADGKRITYTAKGRKGETYTKIISSTAGGAGVTNTVNITSSITVDHASPTDSDSSNYVVYPSGSKSDVVYKLSDSNIKFTVRDRIPAGTQKIQFSYYYSERLEDLNIQIYNSRGKIIGQGGMGYIATFNNPSSGYVTIPLISNSNEDLVNAYVRVTGKAQTQHYSSAGSTPATAHSSIGVTQMKLYF